MGRIKGHYEWDDDDLKPGYKKEGGLHQNLFDGQGKLKGSARFIPDGDTGEEPLAVTETVYVHIDDRSEAEGRNSRDEAIAELVLMIATWGLSTAGPVVHRWWRETGRPAFDARRPSLPTLVRRRRGSKSGSEDFEPSSALIAVPADRPGMSRAEARARYMAALAARAYSDEQMRVVGSADIADGADLSEVQSWLGRLDPADLTDLLQAMAKDPRLLTEDSLANLASVLGRLDNATQIERREPR